MVAPSESNGMVIWRCLQNRWQRKRKCPVNRHWQKGGGSLHDGTQRVEQLHCQEELKWNDFTTKSILLRIEQDRAFALVCMDIALEKTNMLAQYKKDELPIYYHVWANKHSTRNKSMICWTLFSMKKTDYLYFYLVQLLFVRTFAGLKRINIQTDESKEL